MTAKTSRGQSITTTSTVPRTRALSLDMHRQPMPIVDQQQPRAARAAPRRRPARAGMSSSSQPWMIEVGTRAASSGMRRLHADRRRHQEQARDRHLQRHAAPKCRRPGSNRPAPAARARRRYARARAGAASARGDVAEFADVAPAHRGRCSRGARASSPGVAAASASAVTLVASGPLSNPCDRMQCPRISRPRLRARRPRRRRGTSPPSRMRAHRPPWPRIAL